MKPHLLLLIYREITFVFYCVFAGASAVSEESFMVHRDTLALAYQETVDVQRNYQSSTLPYSYVVELAR